MSRFTTSVILFLLLASCGGEASFGGFGGNPTEDEGAEADGGEEEGGGTDTPGVNDGSGSGTGNPDSGDSQSLRALYGGEINSVEYDVDREELVINNLPLDGQIYHEIGSDLDGFQKFTNNDDALREYFAIRRESESGSVEVIAVGTGDYQETGFGGYMVRRASDTVDLPATGEAVYRGPYAGVRVQPGNQGPKDVMLTQGDATLEVDFGDFDVVGAVEGRIEHRKAFPEDGGEPRELPDISLKTGQIEESGRFSGEASGEGVADGGSYVGLFAGRGGAEAGGAILIEDEVDETLERGVFTVVED